MPAVQTAAQPTRAAQAVTAHVGPAELSAKETTPTDAQPDRAATDQPRAVHSTRQVYTYVSHLLTVCEPSADALITYMRFVYLNTS